MDAAPSTAMRPAALLATPSGCLCLLGAAAGTAQHGTRRWVAAKPPHGCCAPESALGSLGGCKHHILPAPCLHAACGGRPPWVAPGSSCITWFWICPGNGRGLAGTGEAAVQGGRCPPGVVACPGEHQGGGGRSYLPACLRSAPALLWAAPCLPSAPPARWHRCYQEVPGCFATSEEHLTRGVAGGAGTRGPVVPNPPTFPSIAAWPRSCHLSGQAVGLHPPADTGCWVPPPPPPAGMLLPRQQVCCAPSSAGTPRLAQA